MLEWQDVPGSLVSLGVWTGAIVPVLFAAYYTWIARWWRNPTGRVIMALDFCVWAGFTDTAVSQAAPVFVAAHEAWFESARLAVTFGASLIILYRMLVFERKRRRLLRRDRLMLVPPKRDDPGPQPRPQRSEEPGAA